MLPQCNHHPSPHTLVQAATRPFSRNSTKIQYQRAVRLSSHHRDLFDELGLLDPLGWNDRLCLVDLLLLLGQLDRDGSICLLEPLLFDAACLALVMILLIRFFSSLLRMSSCSTAGSHLIASVLTVAKMLKRLALSRRIRINVDDLPLQLFCHILSLQVLRHTTVFKRPLHTAHLQTFHL